MSGWILEAIKGSSFKTKLSAMKKFFLEKSKVEDLTKCSLCPNMCRYACPVSIVDGKETTSPAGKARIAYLIKHGYIDLTTENVLPLYYCLSCESCTPHCFFQFNLSELIRPIRVEAIMRGEYPKQLNNLFDNVMNFGCAFGEVEKREHETNNRGDILIFRGCVVRKFYPELSKIATEVIEKLGYKSFVIEDEICCGYLLYEAGHDEYFMKIAKRNAERINRSGAKILLTLSPECTYTYRIIYPRYKIKMKPRVMHITEFIKENMGKIRFSERKERIVIHDPPKLTISLNKTRILLEILSEIPGLKVLRPMRNGKNTFYAGVNNLLYWIDKELLLEINRERLRELEEESNIIVTASPSAKRGLEIAGGKVYDLVEYLRDTIEGVRD